MSEYRDFINVVQGQWTGELLSRTERTEAVMRLGILESDLQSLRIALEDYLAARYYAYYPLIAMAARVDQGGTFISKEVASSRMFHHAQVFVVCMRRFARLLEATRAHKNEYPREVGEAITLTWKKTKSFFDDYREARDAIEHIDGEINGTNWKFTNLWGDILEVVDGKSAPITPKALETVERAWQGIVAEIMRPAEAKVRGVFMRRLIFALRSRAEQLQSLESEPNKTLQAMRYPRA